MRGDNAATNKTLTDDRKTSTRITINFINVILLPLVPSITILFIMLLDDLMITIVRPMLVRERADPLREQMWEQRRRHPCLRRPPGQEPRAGGTTVAAPVAKQPKGGMLQPPPRKFYGNLAVRDA